MTFVTYLQTVQLKTEKSYLVESTFDANRNLMARLFFSEKSAQKCTQSAFLWVTPFRSFYNVSTLAIIKEACVKNVSNALENWIYQSYCLSKPFFANVRVSPTIEFWWTSHKCTGNENMFAVTYNLLKKQDWWVKKSHFLC